MKLIADANILFSLAKPDTAATEITEKYRIQLYTPDHVLKELEKHQKEIEEKTGQKYQKIMKTLKNKIEFIDQKEYQNQLKEAENHLEDPEDAPYLALAIKHRTPIWSNDKHLKKQDKIPVLTTRELIELLTP